jgi:hypothetical protein
MTEKETSAGPGVQDPAAATQTQPPTSACDLPLLDRTPAEAAACTAKYVGELLPYIGKQFETAKISFQVILANPGAATIGGWVFGGMLGGLHVVVILVLGVWAVGCGYETLGT